MKKCPYCAEEIQDEAIVCRYCGNDLLAHLPKHTVTSNEKKVLEQWGFLQKENSKEAGETSRYPAVLLKDAFNFAILAFALGNFSSAIALIQGRLGSAEFWGRFISPAWIFWFFVGIPLSWIWRKFSERFGKWVSFAILGFIFFSVIIAWGFIAVLMELR